MQDLIFKILLAVSTALLVTVLVLVILNLDFGGMHLYQIFRDPIDRIGTESLLQ